MRHADLLLAGGSPASPPPWPAAIFIVEPGRRPRVTSRVDFASYLRANGLEEQACEVLRTRVDSRELLAWFTLETEVALVKLRLDRGVWTS